MIDVAYFLISSLIQVEGFFDFCGGKAMAKLQVQIRVRKCLTRACMVAFGMALPSVCAPQVYSQNVEEFAISKKIAYTGGLTDLTIDLRKLKAGMKGTVTLPISNLTDRPFKINTIITGCSCLNAKSYGNVIPPNGIVDVVIEMTTPSRGQSAQQIQFLRIQESDEVAIQLGMKFELMGAACFIPNCVTPKADRSNNKCVFEVPILVTEPVLLANIRVFGTGDLEGASGKVVSREGRDFALFTLEVPKDGDLALCGELVIQESDQVKNNKIACFINREPRVVVSPRLVRMVRNDLGWAADVILRMNRDSNSVNASEEMELSIGCQGDDGTVLKVVAKKIGSQSYRVQLSIPEKVNEKQVMALPKVLRWQVGWDGGIEEFSTPSRRVE